jgi:DNA-binding transcriptional LysR family regulator
MRRETLEDFIALARHLNFSYAAREQNLTQPGMSKNIQRLERELGFALVVRKKPLELTAAGKHFLTGIQELLGDYDKIIKDCVHLAKTESSLKVAVTPSSESVREITKLSELCGIPLEIVELKTSQSIIDQLANGAADFLIGIGRTTALKSPAAKNIAAVLFDSVPVRICMEKTNALSSKEKLLKKDLQGVSVLVPFGPYYEHACSTITELLGDDGDDLDLTFRTASCTSYIDLFNIDLKGSLLILNLDTLWFDSRPDLAFYDELDGVRLFTNRYIFYRADNEHPNLRKLLSAIDKPNPLLAGG